VPGAMGSTAGAHRRNSRPWGDGTLQGTMTHRVERHDDPNLPACTRVVSSSRGRRREGTAHVRRMRISTSNIMPEAPHGQVHGGRSGMRAGLSKRRTLACSRASRSANASVAVGTAAVHDSRAELRRAARPPRSRPLTAASQMAASFNVGITIRARHGHRRSFGRSVASYRGPHVVTGACAGARSSRSLVVTGATAFRSLGRGAHRRAQADRRFCCAARRGRSLRQRNAIGTCQPIVAPGQPPRARARLATEEPPRDRALRRRPR
jgi:hypothetical protein